MGKVSDRFVGMGRFKGGFRCKEWSTAGPCRDLWRGRCSKYKRGTWNMAFNRAVLLADMSIEMDASVLIQQQMP